MALGPAHGLDHVFVMCAPGAPEMASLAALGATPARSRAHPGQGSRNVCVLFADLMLELLWLDDPATAAREPAAPLALPERAAWRTSGAAPFGLSLRPVPGVPDADLLPDGWDYAPPYLPAGRTIRVARAPRTAPLVFVAPGPWTPPPPGDPLRTRPVVEVAVTVPGGAVALPPACAGVTLSAGPPLMTLRLDGATRLHDLRPALPLRIAA